MKKLKPLELNVNIQGHIHLAIIQDLKKGILQRLRNNGKIFQIYLILPKPSARKTNIINTYILHNW